MSKYAQISLEYLMIFTVAFLMTLPLIIIYAKQSNNAQTDVTNAQIYTLANKMSDYAEQVYYMGEPAQRTLVIDFPEGINNIQLENNLIVFNITTTDRTYLLEWETTANISGEIKNFPGKHIIVFKTENSIVNITDK